VEGITIYISDFKRSLADKLAKDFFTEPSQASVTCAATGPVRIKDMSRIRGSEGGEVPPQLICTWATHAGCCM
jgi:catabolite regulation protein CreA